MAKPKIHLLTIDPQIDFCDQACGALKVPGADEDLARLAKMLRAMGSRIDDVHVTLDSHQRLHIAHPEFTVDKNGRRPAPFTSITSAQVEAGEYLAANPALQGMFLAYLKTLEGHGRYPYVVWPPHCQIGRTGSAVLPVFMDALDEWALHDFAVIDWVPKGSSWATEHYSGVQADVPDPADPTTMLNKRLIQTLEDADIVLFAGQASSHCVANTAADIIDNFSDPQGAKKLTLLTDAMSPVAGYEFLWDAFVAKYGHRVNFDTTTAVAKNL